MKIQKRFIQFLKDEGVFSEYVENWKNNCDPNTVITNKEHYITQAFLWCMFTSKLWTDIENKWQKILKSLNPCDYHTRCHDCGRFVPNDRWVKKDDTVKHWALCAECLSGYDEVY